MPSAPDTWPWEFTLRLRIQKHACHLVVCLENCQIREERIFSLELGREIGFKCKAFGVSPAIGCRYAAFWLCCLRHFLATKTTGADIGNVAGTGI